ncbi:MAG: biopolymer transporter ExbD [Calothrix sp. C42_A2020_038]|nr:biopolymer transporter ExbD [Calothrix sp. C42_A2020_038]
MRLPDEPDVPAQINIVPMIDVVFAILTFFIFSSLSLTRTEGLPVNLPKAATSQQQAINEAPITVTVDPQGQISINGKKTDINSLTEEIQGLISDNQEALVIVSADENSNYGRVIAVMDNLRQVAGVRIAVATQKL